jgi:hypothetical protein
VCRDHPVARVAQEHDHRALRLVEGCPEIAGLDDPVKAAENLVERPA